MNLQRLYKPLLFGFLGALGAFLAAAALGEGLYRLLMPPPAKAAAPTRAKVDIVFCIDITMSMTPAIEGVENGVSRFVSKLQEENVDARLGLVVFADPDYDAREPVMFYGPQFTTDISDFRARLAQLKTHLCFGGDDPEASWRALNCAATAAPSTDGVPRMAVLITDAASNRPAEVGPAAERLKAAGFTQLHLVCSTATNQEWYGAIRNALPGLDLDMTQLTSGTDLDAALPKISQEIVRAVKPLIGSTAVDTRDIYRAVAATAAWTAAMTVGLGLFLVVGQNVYLRRGLMNWKQAVFGLPGLLVVGLIAGAVVSMPALVVPANWVIVQVILRTFLYAILGGITGLGVAPFIRNLKFLPAAFGGAAGGFAGGFAYQLAEGLGGDMLGRLAGATLIGLGIGLMIAIVEQAVRAAWLELRYGPKDVIRVNLGPKPVVVGADRERCDLPVRSAPPVAVKAWLESGRLMAEDVAGGVTPRVVPDGQTYQAGTAQVVLRSQTSATTQAAPSSMQPAAPPASYPPATYPPAAQPPAASYPASAQPVAVPPARAAPPPIRPTPVAEPARPTPMPSPVPAPAAPVGGMAMECRLQLADGAQMTLREGTPLVGAFIRGVPNVDSARPIAELVRTPRGTTGLRNLGSTPWTVIKNGRPPQTIPTGRGVEIEPGMRVRIGEGEFGVG